MSATTGHITLTVTAAHALKAVHDLIAEGGEDEQGFPVDRANFDAIYRYMEENYGVVDGRDSTRDALDWLVATGRAIEADGEWFLTAAGEIAHGTLEAFDALPATNRGA